VSTDDPLPEPSRGDGGRPEARADAERGAPTRDAEAGDDRLLSRREMLAVAGGTVSTLALAGRRAAGTPAAAAPRREVPDRLRQSASRWPYREIPLPEFARAAAAIGLAGIDLLQPEEWPVVADQGLICSMGYPTERQDFITSGFNRRENHPRLLRELEAAIPRAAAEGVPNLIAMFGDRGGLSDAEGIEACAAGLRAIAPLAEEEGVTVCLELLNSKVDHPDYQGDRTAFGVEVAEAVGSPRVKLLYDIYHMQIMEGDVIRTIRRHIDHIAHFHTGGVPGRHELDDAQELNYRGICRAIAETGFDGFVAHEFVPTREPLDSLREAFAVCDVPLGAEVRGGAA
jgi:hydroxypyruvate isomerase